MALVLADRVLETCTSPGTGAVTLLGAATGYQTFSAGIGNGNTCYYCIADQGGANWEVGIGTYSSVGNTLTRTTPISGSAATPVNFSSGTQNVFVTYPAEKSVNLDANGKLRADSNYYVDFASAAPATIAGRMWYDGTNGSWNLGMGGGNITQQVGEELLVYGKASSAVSGETILQAIYKTGTVGASGVITFAPTVSGITDGGLIIGVGTEDIATNGFGRITNFGIVHGINTTGSTYGETWADGDDIWYNPTTGGLTKTKPSAPGIKCQIGTVINAGSGGSGSFQVLLNAGSVLGGTDSNVQFGTLATGNLIQYNGTYWTNVAASSITVGAAGSNTQVQYNSSGVLGASSNFTFDGTNIGLAAGTANGVAYLNGSKVLTTGSALTFDGSTLTGSNATSAANFVFNNTASGTQLYASLNSGTAVIGAIKRPSATNDIQFDANYGSIVWGIGSVGTASEQMRLTSTGLGIGTSSPAGRVDSIANGYSAYVARSASSGSNQTVDVIKATDSAVAYYANARYTANAHLWNIGGSEAMRIDSSLNLGLGRTPPTGAAGYTGFNVGAAMLYGAPSGALCQLTNNSDINDKYIVNGYASRLQQYQGAFAFFTAPSGTAGNAISFTQAMTLDASGNLVVGATTALEKLHVAGGLLSTSGNNSADVVDGAIMDYSAGDTRLIASRSGATNANMLFYTTSSGTLAERMRITANGGISFGSSGTAYGTTGQVLTSNGDSPPTWSTPSSGSTTKTWTSFTASGTYTVPAGVTSIRAYAFGKGGNGASSSYYGGSGGGCAFGDIAVTAGQNVTITISAGVATVTYGGVTKLTANPGADGTASVGAVGTASKDASVTNGGAYSGGAGGGDVSWIGGGGGSSGSPLGNGYAGGGKNGNGGNGSSGGGGWGGTGALGLGNTGGGGGGVGAAAADYTAIGGGTTSNGQARTIYAAFSDPLLNGCDSAKTATGNGQNGCGGASGSAGGLGGGGGGTTSIGGAGGFGGGGAGGGGNNTNNGGAGGYGGGGGAGATGGTGGAAIVLIYA